MGEEGGKEGLRAWHAGRQARRQGQQAAPDGRRGLSSPPPKVPEDDGGCGCVSFYVDIGSGSLCGGMRRDGRDSLFFGAGQEDKMRQACRIGSSWWRRARREVDAEMAERR